MRIFFMNRFFYPDQSATSQMLSDLAFGLAERGHDISVITSRLDFENKERRLPPRESIRGVNVIRISTTGFGRSNLAGRALDYISFYASAAWTLWRHLRRGDLVIAKTDPPLLSIIAAPVAWLRGAKAGNWLQDIFPEVATALGMGGKGIRQWPFALLAKLRNATLRHASLNVAIGERMAERLQALSVPAASVAVIPNWADGRLVYPIAPSQNILRREWGLDGSFVVGYSGNLGRAHDSATIVDAIAKLGDGVRLNADMSRIQWLFIGGGAEMRRLRANIDQRCLKGVHFHPYQPRDQLAQSLSVPDVHLISLRPELEGLIVPSKYYGIAAAGRPAIFIGDPDGEIARLVRKNGTGLVVAQGDSQGLVRAITTLANDPAKTRELGERSRKLFLESFDLPFGIGAWEKLIRTERFN